MAAHSTSPGAESLLPDLVSEIPGPRSRELAERLEQVESHNVTCLSPRPPIFWERASGANVWDVDGNRFVDLSAAFGVANVGHAHPDVVEAVQRQAATLLHGMGDVHPPDVKVELLEALVARFPGGVPAKAVLMSSGSDAVETAIKTAMLATGKPGLVAFEGGYHGMGLGALDATWRADFREPFATRLPGLTTFAHYGDLTSVSEAAGRCAEAGANVAAILVEPLQGRGGERLPGAGFLPGLRALCDERGWLLIIDEVYTGFGRTGRWFACEHEGVVPDLLCVGKGLASGMPISACLGRSSVMDAWPVSTGEALHTQTFLGHPVGCAAALASMRVLEREGLVERAADKGTYALLRLRERLAGRAGVRDVRGLGLMIGIECASRDLAARATTGALEQGVIVLPSGETGRVLSITPALCIGTTALRFGIDVLCTLLQGRTRI
jgi:4-aminobutyrate aminotransferase/(S)-3-amino-2-methylpropionate transaminase